MCSVERRYCCASLIKAVSLGIAALVGVAVAGKREKLRMLGVDKTISKSRSACSFLLELLIISLVFISRLRFHSFSFRDCKCSDLVWNGRQLQNSWLFHHLLFSKVRNQLSGSFSAALWSKLRLDLAVAIILMLTLNYRPIWVQLLLRNRHLAQYPSWMRSKSYSV